MITEIEQIKQDAELKTKVEILSEGKSNNDIAEDSLKKIREINNAIQAELLKNEELRAKILLGGKAQAGQYIPEETPEQKTNSEAKKILDMFR